MKVTSYALDGPTKGLYKQHCILAHEARSVGYVPLIYLQRPKWIKDDDCWLKIVNSVQIKLPKNFEVK